ncbi:hypothetical protein IQ230_09710 [Gloeocapsopsis crepidinum LEGE 06123]|uniref:Uncharacterized protein n=1 Tax=Gloeocapsopsis crepidinum LEGE 06123 TaxID=588587 RepID=A0ABR9UQS6_9CHRO|nr:hypothetical protein [Gloeocapsopsis crepidinum]MBE9190632.1 hypothetical protein [Gloeocapsopsis crepidinum LEGE 06123]
MPRAKKTTKQTTEIPDSGNYFSGEYTVDSHEKPKRTTIEDYPEEVRQYYVVLNGKPYNTAQLPPHYRNYMTGINLKSGVSIQSFKEETPSDKGIDSDGTD